MSDTKTNHSSLVREHFDSKYHDYDVLIRKLIPRYAEMHQLVVDVVDFSPEQELRILDLGIGTGQTSLALLKKYRKAHIDGVDISENMLAQGRERLNNYSGRVNFILADIKDVELKHRYDVCVAVLCVHHLNEKEKQELFHKVRNVLKTGGVFVIGDIVKFDTMEETMAKEEEWKAFLISTLGEEEGQYWFDNYREEDLPSPAADQEDWLRTAGFADVKRLWEYMNYAVIRASLPSSA